MAKWVLKVGVSYFCYDYDQGRVLLRRDTQDEKLCTWPSQEEARKAGIWIFDDPHCIKFRVEKL